jgi:hypothetical protein
MTIRPLVLICIVVFAVAMFGVRLAAHGIVDNFGPIGALVTVAAMLAAARWYDWHHRERP